MPRAEGVHAAYYQDNSGVAIFATEVKALRHAVDHSMSYAYWPYGMTLADAIKAHEASKHTQPVDTPRAPRKKSAVAANNEEQGLNLAKRLDDVAKSVTA